MDRRRLVIVALVALAFGAAAVVLLTGGGDRKVPETAREDPPKAPELTAPAEPLGARLLRRTQLRASPGGRVVSTIGTRTEFKSRRVLAVVERRGAWLGVLSEKMPNSRAGWIPAAAAELRHQPYALEVNLSERRVTVLREGRAVRRFRVAVGRAGTATPTGRYGVTDSLRIGGGSSAYGCCAIAFTARQPNIPQGWTGGDRIALHGTTSESAIGTSASLGCLRARNADMRWLMRRITLGSPVTIRA